MTTSCSSIPSPSFIDKPGVGFFMNSTDTVEFSNSGIRSDYKKLLEIMKLSKATWSALWIASPDGRKISLERIRRCAENMRANDLEPILWIFPSEKDPVGHCKHILECARISNIFKVILDIEVEFKSKPEAAKAFVDALKDIRKQEPRLRFAFSSYPFGHGTFPWKVFGDSGLIETVLPQLYISGDSVQKVDRSWTHYRSYFGAEIEVIPVAASYIENAARMKKSLKILTGTSKVVRLTKPKSLCVWVLRTTDKEEAKVLAEVVLSSN